MPSQGLLCLENSGNLVLPIKNTPNRMFRLGNAYIYNNGAWQQADMKVYYNGQWFPQTPPVPEELVLFDNGTTEYTFAGGKVSGTYTSSLANATADGTAMYLNIAYGANNAWSGAYLAVQSPIDVTAYKKLCVQLGSSANVGFGLVKSCLALLNDKTASGNTSAALTNAVKYENTDQTDATFTSGTTLSLDISGISGSYYPAIVLWSISNSNVQTYYSKMWLEA